MSYPDSVVQILRYGVSYGDWQFMHASNIGRPSTQGSADNRRAHYWVRSANIQRGGVRAHQGVLVSDDAHDGADWSGASHNLLMHLQKFQLFI